ncbi:MAG: hypothetical protein WC541_05020 [Dehalococcoidia bacterium]
MFRVHYFLSSPEGYLTVELYVGPYLLNRWVFTERRAFHGIAAALHEADRQINPEGYPETAWSPELTQAVIDALT